MSLASDIAEHALLMERADRASKALAGAQDLDVLESENAKFSERENVRAKAREHWCDVILPHLRSGTLPYDLRRGYY